MDATLETLLAEAAWVRKLARTLGGGEDLEQETWVSALKSPPRVGLPRPWLAEVMRNARRMAFRGESRRLAREQAVELAGSAEGPEQHVEALELSRILVEAVLALDEPYRETLPLRYWRGLTSAESGRQLHVPAGTARSHLEVGVGRVRATLDGRYRGRDTWKRAFVGSRSSMSPPQSKERSCGSSVHPSSWPSRCCERNVHVTTDAIWS